MIVGIAVVAGIIVVAMVLISHRWWLFSRAKRVDQIVVPLSRQEARAAAARSFDLIWADDDGPGDINRRRRTRMSSATWFTRRLQGCGPTLSVTLEVTRQGDAHVRLWMSKWSRPNGLPFMMGAAVHQKRRIRESLEAAALPQHQA